MPEIRIKIDEHQEAKILDAIDNRRSFMIEGPVVKDSDGKRVILKGITFEFFADNWDGSRQPVESVNREERLDES